MERPLAKRRCVRETDAGSPSRVAGASSTCPGTDTLEGCRRGSRAEAGLLSLPDAVILSIMGFIRDGQEQQGGGKPPPARVVVGKVFKVNQSPTVGTNNLVGNNSSGKYVSHGCRALASTCRRIRDLFRNEFICAFQMRQRGKILVDGKVMASFDKAFLVGAYDVLKRYSVGVRVLLVSPGFIHVAKEETWNGASRSGLSNRFLRSICPRLETVTLLSYGRLFSNRDENKIRSLVGHLEPRVQNMLSQATPAFGKDLLRHATFLLNVELHGAIAAVVGAVFEKGSGAPGIDERSRRVAARDSVLFRGPRLFSSPGFESMKLLTLVDDVLETFPWEVLARLECLEKLQIFGSIATVDSVGKHFPPSLRILKYRSRTLQFRRQCVGHLGLSGLPNLEELDLFMSFGCIQVHGIEGPTKIFSDTYSKDYIATLLTVGSQTLKRLSLAFWMGPLGKDGCARTAFHLDQLSSVIHRFVALERFCVRVPVRGLSDFLDFAATASSVCSPAIHVEVESPIWCPAPPCIYSVLEELQKRKALYIASVGFCGVFGCADSRAMSEIDQIGRMMWPKFEGVSKLKAGHDDLLTNGTCSVHGRE